MFRHSLLNLERIGVDVQYIYINYPHLHLHTLRGKERNPGILESSGILESGGIHEILSLTGLTYTAVFKGFFLRITQSFIELSDTIFKIQSFRTWCFQILNGEKK